jgi:hypothetical protein
MILAVLAGGCALGEILADYGEPVDLRSADVVGTWQSGTTDSGTSRSIVFTDDGDFTATNLPRAAVAFLVDGRGVGRVDGSGTWTLAANTSGDVQASVALSFDRLADVDVASSGPDLSALRQDNGAIYLFFFYVDQGNSWTSYQKCAPDCP